MRTNSLIASAGLIASLLATASPAAAQRAESVEPGRMFRTSTCPITPATALTSETGEATQEFLPALMVTMLAGIAGSLVTSGLTAAGDALESVSKEKGIVAEGTTSFALSQLNPRSDTSRAATVTQRPTCLVLYRPGTRGDIAGLASVAELQPLKSAATASGISIPLFGSDSQREAVLAVLRDNGIERMPSVYVEAMLLHRNEGIVIRPVLVWYHEKMPGAPPGAAASEYHLTLATPGATDIGAAFANARLVLPRIAPKSALGWNELKQSRSLMVPHRPAAGFVETRLTAANLAYAQVATRNKELVAAQRAYDVAAEKLRRKPRDEAAIAGEKAAGLVLADSKKDLAEAQTQASAVVATNLGATNAKARFVVVREPNKFGLALAKALKGQAEAAGKAVTTELSPKPDWAATDTAYLAAQAALAAKQREYDSAVAAGDAAAIAKLGDELLVAKAKMNEAAVAVNRPIPFPSLF